MFNLYGDTAQLVRYLVKYENKRRKLKDGEVKEVVEERIERCTSDEHRAEFEAYLAANEIPFVTEPVNQHDNEWFDGLKFKSYDEAKAVFEAGEEAYNQKLAQENLLKNQQIRADLDYIAIMAGVEI